MSSCSRGTPRCSWSFQCDLLQTPLLPPGSYRPGDDAVCGEVIEVVLRHGADVRVVRCLFGLRSKDKVFIEGTKENITFVVRAIKSDYEHGRMTGKKWKSRDAENADAAAHDDDDDCETQPEHEGEHE